MHETKKCKKCQEAEERLKKQIEEVTEQAKRAAADLVNYKRRTEEDQKNFIEFANSGLLFELLPVLDNLERACRHIPEDSELAKDFGKGIIQIYDHFKTTLQKAGLTEIEAGPGTQFNPHFHEALMPGKGEKDKILEELEKGYTLSGRVLRPAKVKVGDGS